MQIKFKLLIFTLIFANNLNLIACNRSEELCDARSLEETIKTLPDTPAIINVLKVYEDHVKDGIVNDHGNTPLHVSAYYGKYHATKIFLAFGAKVNAICRTNHTPLHMAGFRRYPSAPVVQLLLDAGADLTIKNNRDETPGQLARKNAPARIADIIDAEHARRARWNVMKKEWLTAVFIISKNLKK